MTQPPINVTAKSGQLKLVITWEPEHVAEYGFKYLRCHCACALCVDEHSRVRVLDPGTIPDDIRIENMVLKGHYAVQIIWSDGHDTGIYSWAHLRNICPCAKCSAES